jgi:trehalose-6-phosphate synthase
VIRQVLSIRIFFMKYSFPSDRLAQACPVHPALPQRLLVSRLITLAAAKFRRQAS